MFYTLSIQNSVSKVILAIGEALSDFIKWVISFLPNDPYNLSEVLAVPQSVRNVLGFVNWLIPIRQCLNLIFIWFGCVMAIYFVRVILKAAHFI